MKRFIERFQLWRQERTEELEDKFVAWLLFLAALVIGLDTYTLIITHHVTWSAVVGIILLLAFLVLYLRRSRGAWLLLMVFALASLASVPFTYASAPPQAPAEVRLFSAAFVLGFGVAAFIYSLVIRKRFARGT